MLEQILSLYFKPAYGFINLFNRTYGRCLGDIFSSFLQCNLTFKRIWRHTYSKVEFIFRKKISSKDWQQSIFSWGRTKNCKIWYLICHQSGKTMKECEICSSMKTRGWSTSSWLQTSRRVDIKKLPHLGTQISLYSRFSDQQNTHFFS